MNFNSTLLDKRKVRSMIKVNKISLLESEIVILISKEKPAKKRHPEYFFPRNTAGCS